MTPMLDPRQQRLLLDLVSRFVAEHPSNELTFETVVSAGSRKIDLGTMLSMVIHAPLENLEPKNTALRNRIIAQLGEMGITPEILERNSISARKNPKNRDAVEINRPAKQHSTVQYPKNGCSSSEEVRRARKAYLSWASLVSPLTLMKKVKELCRTEKLQPKALPLEVSLGKTMQPVKVSRLLATFAILEVQKDFIDNTLMPAKLLQDLMHQRRENSGRLGSVRVPGTNPHRSSKPQTQR